ncbi:MAG: hypothetical protein JO250_06870 [Armatimonadetes bacterium]|nr:hypothetical protein [Armatimonadota bacterium]
MKEIKEVLITDARRALACLRALFANRNDSRAWDRASLCSMAPLSADAFRHNEEAEHSHGHWY